MPRERVPVHQTSVFPVSFYLTCPQAAPTPLIVANASTRSSGSTPSSLPILQPLLDVVLFTRSLSRTMGYRAQFGLYAYYLGAGALLKATAPPLARMVAQESALTGAFRAAHQVPPSPAAIDRRPRSVCLVVYPEADALLPECGRFCPLQKRFRPFVCLAKLSPPILLRPSTLAAVSSI